MAALTVRLARPDDLARVFPLVAALADGEGATPPHPARFAETWNRAFAEGAGFRFAVAERAHALRLAELPGEVVGCMSLHDRFSTWTGAPFLEVQDLYVVPAARRQGVASALLEFAEREAGKRGAARLELQVLHDNAAALALYRRLGFDDAGYRVLRKKVEAPDPQIEGLFG